MSLIIPRVFQKRTSWCSQYLPVVLLVIPVIFVARVPARTPSGVGAPRAPLTHSCAIPDRYYATTTGLDNPLFTTPHTPKHCSTKPNNTGTQHESKKKRNFDSTGAVFWRKLQQREVRADHATANFADANVTLAREGSALYRNWLRFKFDRQIN